MFQIWRDSLHRLRSYCWETARRSIRPHFSVHPVGKTMRWIENWRHNFDGHDELYHRAKIGEDRTTRAGCRCENVVFVFFLPAGCREIYSQTKNHVFRPEGATRCTNSGQTLQGRRAPGSAWLYKISPQSAQGVGMRPKISKISTFLVQSPTGANPLTDFLKFRGFIRLTIIH